MAEASTEPKPTDYVRVKRKKQTIFIYMEPAADTIHDLRAKVNLISKVPTTDIKFFIDSLGEVQLDENKSLADQKVRGAHTHTHSHTHTHTPPLFFSWSAHIFWSRAGSL